MCASKSEEEQCEGECEGESMCVCLCSCVLSMFCFFVSESEAAHAKWKEGGKACMRGEVEEQEGKWSVCYVSVVMHLCV